MGSKSSSEAAGRSETDATYLEQLLCLEALESGEYDTMRDNDWVKLCESVAKQGNEALRQRAKTAAE